MADDDEYDSEEDADFEPEEVRSGKNDSGKLKVVVKGGGKSQGEITTSRHTEGARDQTQPADPLADLKVSAKKAKINALWEQLNAPTKKAPVARIGGLGSIMLPTSTRVTSGRQLSAGPKSQALRKSLAHADVACDQSLRGDSPVSKKSKQENQREVTNKEPVKASSLAVAAAALAAAKTALSLPDAASREGKVEVTEVCDFAGEQVTVSKLVDVNGKSAPAKRKLDSESTSQLDALLQSMEKKKKMNILDKSRKDWGEFKDEKKIVEDLESYKKSGDKYLDKVAFLNRAELREFEIERDLRMASRRRSDVSSKHD